MEQSSNSIAEPAGLKKKRVLRALLKIRMALATDVPGTFTTTVEVDDTYLGGSGRNKQMMIRDSGARNGRGTSKKPVLGILCRNGHLCDKIVKSVEEETLLLLFSKKVEKGSTVCPETWKAWAGIAAGGYVHHLVNRGKKTTLRRKRESH